MLPDQDKSSLFYVIIGPVMEDERLSHSEMIFYALMSGLANSKGYCFASDEHLSKRMRSSPRTIREWLHRLESFGYILRDTKKIGMKWERKIFVIPPDSKKVYERNPAAVSIGATPPHRAAPHRHIVIKKISNKDPPLPPPKKQHDQENIVYTEEEEEFFKRKMMIRKGSPIVDLSEYKKSIILKNRREESSVDQLDQNTPQRIEMAKSVFELYKKDPKSYIGKISIDSLGILSCTVKGRVLLPLSPKEPIKDWKLTIESWKKER